MPPVFAVVIPSNKRLHYETPGANRVASGRISGCASAVFTNPKELSLIHNLSKAMGFAIVVTSLTLVGASAGWAQQKAANPKQQIVGVWKLASVTHTQDGVTKAGSSFGPTPAGRLVFTSSGSYVSVNTNPNLPKFASNNRATGTADENKAVVQGSIAGFGTYDVSADGKTLTMRQESGTFANRNGGEEKRPLTLAGDEMKYTTAATVGGSSELVYKRLK
jgi:hypothetical protein